MPDLEGQAAGGVQQHWPNALFPSLFVWLFVCCCCCCFSAMTYNCRPQTSHSDAHDKENAKPAHPRFLPFTRRPAMLSYLFRGIRLDEDGVNAFGFGQQLGLRVDALVLLAGQPELNVLLAELRPEELRKGRHAV